MDKLNQRIKQARNHQKLSQASLAQLTGVSQPTVANWENGSHMPRHAMIEHIGLALKVEPNWLLSGDSGQSTRRARTYLTRPIAHIPVHDWPQPENSQLVQSGATDFEAPIDFIPFTGGQAHFQAFLRPHPSTGAADVYICDNQDITIAPDNLYLVKNTGKMETALGRDLAGLTPLARVVCRLTHYS